MTTQIEKENAIVAQALEILTRRVLTTPVLEGPDDVKKYLVLSSSSFEREMFSGSVNQTNVYPREIARKALQLNATSIIITHNHPSGNVTPSNDDYRITKKMKAAMEIIDVVMFDHIITGGGESFWFAENGLL